MAKDPAVLFYYQDFLVGTQFMSDSEVGQYMRILCHQADKGVLTEEQVLSICRANAIPKSIREKLLVDEDGLFYQKRMREEKEKRSLFVESRRKNAFMTKAYAKHMEDEIDNEIDSSFNKNIEESFEKLWEAYPNRQGKKNAKRHFLGSVKDINGLQSIWSALKNYTESGNVKNGFIKNGSTWFNEWQDWIEPTEIMMKGNGNGTTQRSSGQGIKKSGAGGASTDDDVLRTLELARQNTRSSN